ncbi:scarecrow-like protein 21 [Andrographis paniculata]|uniref:scarecrow-like protein 21 n=1 Tax=Andrographis paniculata TaxID=175694 RepID=UPI0021E7ED46|nr:scarecrow-like protein 21 [Andrographis paniculata]XP_051125112.1 scarecrow-like protein 21 [Andrographis paniculata]XP_051125113.1 scarecrow-like protein 21 [Andrographis paniculata]
MGTSQNYPNLAGTGRFHQEPQEELESYFSNRTYDLDHCISPDGGSPGIRFSDQPYEQHCVLGPSAAIVSNPFYNSSTASLSSNGSSNSQPDCLSDTNNSVSQIPDAFNQFSPESVLPRGIIETVRRKDLRELLITCAKAVAENNQLMREYLMSELRSMVSVTGEPLQRLGAYMLEGLVARLAQSGSSIYKALRCKEPTSTELLSYMHLLYEVCPYFKFGYLSANGAIAEAMKNENWIHIVDFQIAQGAQWMTLIQALASRPGGPPHVHITGIDDSASAYARGGGLEIVGQRLSRLAESCGVPFEFHGLAISGRDVESKHLDLRPEEALAVNFALTLHHVPDESVSTQNHRDRILRMVKSLSPKVVTLVEQESNTNTAPFLPRFIETMNYYLAIFESIDVALPRDHKERVNVEQHCLAREIVNIIACEGQERVERHELLGKWKLRFAMAKFAQAPLSSFVNMTIKNLLKSYNGNYRLQENDGCLFLGWMDKDLVSSCAWI